ncbi:MAG: hypothetical protein DI548_01905 [Flavobacterium johnsoniae]|nr:MAG: hypothetical protein DI548_01905 [Flavobacterium johnsoniae]
MFSAQSAVSGASGGSQTYADAPRQSSGSLAPGAPLSGGGSDSGSSQQQQLLAPTSGGLPL